MKIKVKKKNKDGIVRLETSGSLKEFIFKEDFLEMNDSSVLLCFKGKDSSGIVEISEEEIEKFYKEIEKRKNFIGETKVIEFEK